MIKDKKVLHVTVIVVLWVFCGLSTPFYIHNYTGVFDDHTKGAIISLYCGSVMFGPMN